MQLFSYQPSEYFGSCMYLIKSNDEYALIDPSLSPENLLQEHPDINLRYILLTHAHFDHMLFLSRYKERFPTAKVLVCDFDSEGLCDPYYNASRLFLQENILYHEDFQTVTDGDFLSLGFSKIKIHSFSGHTKGSIVIETENKLFVGDLLFWGGGFGRYDLPSGDRASLHRSLVKFYETFSCAYSIYPGHGAPFSFENALKWKSDILSRLK